MNKKGINNENFKRIEKAIQYIVDNFNKQPNLEEIAKHVSVSPFHFQRLFKEWAGVSPKKFIEFLTLQHAKKKLIEKEKSLAELSEESGLSSPSRLHDLFINIEGMSPGTYKKKGEGLVISAYNYNTVFGSITVGATEIGICHTSFTEDGEVNIEDIKHQFPKAEIQVKKHLHHESIVKFINQKKGTDKINLHLSGTPFQLKVWHALINIPEGNLASYNQVAKMINNQKATRAVASAVAKNPVAILIPCHRIIQSSGFFGEYHWGKARKTAIIGYEASKNMRKNEEYILTQENHTFMKHNYKATIKWTGNTSGKGTTGYNTFERSHEIIIEDKAVIQGSSDPAFRGDPTKHNPEELFLASISSCHMLWYLHLCASEKITVLTYKDNANGVMLENKDGSGHFTEVTLKPYVIIKEHDKLQRAIELHHTANQKCFIANSCNFTINHEPQIKIHDQ